MNSFQFTELLQRISMALAPRTKEFLLLAGKDLEGRMKSRIFNKGKNSSDGSIGSYKSKWWKKIRQDGKAGSQKYRFSGRQIGYVDLEYSSDLRNSIQVVQDRDSTALAIIDDHNYDKAMGQELIQGRKAGTAKMEIFTPTKKEEKAVQEYVNDLIDLEIDKILKRYQ